MIKRDRVARDLRGAFVRGAVEHLTNVIKRVNVDTKFIVRADDGCLVDDTKEKGDDVISRLDKETLARHDVRVGGVVGSDGLARDVGEGDGDRWDRGASNHGKDRNQRGLGDRERD